MPAGENAIIEYLSQNPDFLIRHPDLLKDLSVPHGFQGKAVSLLEYQARLLRERLRGLELQCESENLKAKAHRHLSKQLKPLVRVLCECTDRRRILDILETFLIDYYSATSIRIFAAAVSGSGLDGNRKLLRPLDAWRRGLFTLLLNNPKPLCDSLQIEHLSALFGEEAEQIHSSLLVPFRFRGHEALLAAGSTEWNQYRHGVDLDILATVIEIVSHLTEPAAAC
ncbi:MAG: DUF484 family protein [Methylococcaceae bacterium]|nr:DUF484 family protein [Methylococcaceae bacterium]MCI0732585.1 DUF484 family protein [Methylococcaceae bacterium]